MFASAFRVIRQSLAARLVAANGVLLLASVATLSGVAMHHQKRQALDGAVSGAERLSTTIKLGTHYAMMLNSREDITAIVRNIGRQPEIISVRVYNKEGAIKFSNRLDEVETRTNIREEACHVCHMQEPPRTSLSLEERTRFFDTPLGERRVGMLTPIENEPGCSDNCHFHPPEKQILGAIDLVLSREEADREIATFTRSMLFHSAGVFVVVSCVLLAFMVHHVNRPIRALIETTRRIARGEAPPVAILRQGDEMGQLAEAVAVMGREIAGKQKDLNRQRDEYQNLFANVPCFVTVQDRNFRLQRYNREFAEQFRPRPGDHCYKAYKGRTEKCPDCPVEETFRTGRSVSSEETGLDSQGQPRHWFVTTAPLRNAKGEVTAAMEMSLDITAHKQLERQLRRSEAKYLAIFNTIPTPVFLLDRESLVILDGNLRVEEVYGADPCSLVGTSFLEFFPEPTRERHAAELRVFAAIDRATHVTRDGRRIHVSVQSSPVECAGRNALLVTVSDITARLEAEQQLIHAGKMTTLGEMATGVAHELNQPLTVIKAAASYILKKLRAPQGLDPTAIPVLTDLAKEMDSHVDRASKIINHLREFGRKPEIALGPVDMAEVLTRSLDMFRQQLALREIDVRLDLPENLPSVLGDAGRLEQVFVNLLLNGRDAIEEKWATGPRDEAKRIHIQVELAGDRLRTRVADTGGGIPPLARARLFEPFFTTKPPGKGTGLGLSICHGIVADCGGEIRVEETSAAGSVFVIDLPLIQTESEARAMPREDVS